jgi:5'-methylthioadenosine phosphorylase
MTSVDRVIGIIGGSGIYDVDGLTRKIWKKIDSAYGQPSDELLIGEYSGGKIVFLPRHGRGHVHSPSEINYRANIEALKRAGVTDVISVSAVGSLREHLAPGTFVIVDQFVDRTYLRQKSFFGSGCVAHVSMAHPVCSRLGDHVERAAKESGIQVVRGGTYLVMEGPQFSTRGESELYRSWGCDVIGMTNMPEAKLAREAELCYASVSMVTDFDCWHPGHENVSVDQIVSVLKSNADSARTLVKAVAPKVFNDSHGPNCSCGKSLENALITAPGHRSPIALEKLKYVAGRILS